MKFWKIRFSVDAPSLFIALVWHENTDKRGKKLKLFSIIRFSYNLFSKVEGELFADITFIEQINDNFNKYLFFTLIMLIQASFQNRLDFIRRNS